MMQQQMNESMNPRPLDDTLPSEWDSIPANFYIDEREFEVFCAEDDVQAPQDVSYDSWMNQDCDIDFASHVSDNSSISTSCGTPSPEFGRRAAGSPTNATIATLSPENHYPSATCAESTVSVHNPTTTVLPSQHRPLHVEVFPAPSPSSSDSTATPMSLPPTPSPAPSASQPQQTPAFEPYALAQAVLSAVGVQSPSRHGDQQVLMRAQDIIQDLSQQVNALSSSLQQLDRRMVPGPLDLNKPATTMQPPQLAVPPAPVPPQQPPHMTACVPMSVGATLMPTPAPQPPLRSLSTMCSPVPMRPSVYGTMRSVGVRTSLAPMCDTTMAMSGMALKITSPVEMQWYADRPLPPFTVALVHADGEPAQVLTHVSGWKVRVSMVDGFGKDASEKLTSSMHQHTFMLSQGTANISSLRFCSVSSKAGGYFRLVLSVVFPDAAKVVPTVQSDKIQVLSYRLYHSPKVPLDKLTPEDSVAKMRGIGHLYSRRFAKLGIQRVWQLARLDVSQLGQLGSKRLLELLRKDRGALTLAKLNEYVKQAQEIVARYEQRTSGGTCAATPPSTPPSTPPPPPARAAPTTSSEMAHPASMSAAGTAIPV